MATLKAGARVQSAVCATEVMVVQAPDGDVELHCGGVPMIELGVDKPGGAVSAPGGTQIGKRYVNAAGNIEVLCTKPGDGALALGTEVLVPKEAKALPSSD